MVNCDIVWANTVTGVFTLVKKLKVQTLSVISLYNLD